MSVIKLSLKGPMNPDGHAAQAVIEHDNERLRLDFITFPPQRIASHCPWDMTHDEARALALSILDYLPLT